MIIKILYFARIKEAVNYSSEEVDLPANVSTILALKNYLALRGDTWVGLFNGKQLVRAAINHALVDDWAVIQVVMKSRFSPLWLVVS